jgi:hypothetical protein
VGAGTFLAFFSLVRRTAPDSPPSNRASIEQHSRGRKRDPSQIGSYHIHREGKQGEAGDGDSDGPEALARKGSAGCMYGHYIPSDALPAKRNDAIRVPWRMLRAHLLHTLRAPGTEIGRENLNAVRRTPTP